MAEITGDYFNELLPLDMKYRALGGLDAVVQHLRQHPVRTYEERRDSLLELAKESPNRYAEIQEGYRVTEQNVEAVRKLNKHVKFLNLAAKKGKLTNSLFEAFLARLS